MHMIPVIVAGVRMEMPSNTPIVLLNEVDGTRFLPIWVGAVEATAIAYAQQGVTPPRPMTHDLIVDLIDELGASLTGVRITALTDGVFFAILDLMTVDGQIHELSSRPSDAIALALRVGVPITVAPDVLDTAGVEIPEDAEGEPEDQVEAFREFLEGVSPEDFDAPS
jgi:bifunctional DNase/RNase